MIPAQEWSRQVVATDDDGTPLAPDERPLRVALAHGTPSHRSLQIRDAAGRDRSIEVTALPLFAHAKECVGAMSIFWEPEV